MTQLFSVYDNAAKRYIDPFYAPTVEYALRGFRSSVQENEQHMFSRFPEDYALFHIGSFDPEKGVLNPEAPRLIATAASLKNPPAPSTAPQLEA